MKITMETDYAFRIMRYLAREGRSDGKTVAEYIGAPQRFTVKILGKLASAGLIESSRGANGGYMLSKSPEEITLRSIFEITEGPLTISRCQGEGSCPHGNGLCDCYFNRIFDEIDAAIAEKLDSVTLKDSI